MSSYRIGMNLRVTEDSNQGGRRYMEDRHSIRFVKNDEGGFEFAYFGIFDGHGGGEASKYARDHLLNEITKYDCFWSDNDEDILYAIKSAFLDTHYGMWKQLENWPKTNSGLPSTAGTTASICIIKNSKLYIGHVGDSGIVLGFDETGSENCTRPKAKMLTIDHKPDSPVERERIEGSGGQVVAKAGVQRVVWNRPRVNHKGPIRRSTQIDRIPFLAVARSLGDLWSYNYLKEEFVVSPEPDVSVHQLRPALDKCLVIGSDGLWNMLSADEAVNMVVDLENQFENKVINDPTVPVSYWINPAERLVQCALNKWRMRLMKADNTSCIVVLIDPLGPRKLSILKRKREERMTKLADKSYLDEKTSVNLLAPAGSLSKSPKKAKDKTGKLVDIGKPVALWKEPIRFSLSSTDDKPSPVSNSPMHKFSDALDDSIQLRNAHLVTPVTFTDPQENKLVTKSASSPTRTSHKTSPLQTSASVNTSRSCMVTRSSPNKSLCATLDTKSSSKHNTSSIPANKSKLSDSNSAKESNANSRTNQTSPNSLAHQKCLQPSKQSLDNVRMNKLTTNIKTKDLENMFINSDVKLNLKNLNISKYPSKVKNSKNLNNSNTSEGNKTSKKSHSSSTRSFSSRISLRLRRIRQKSKAKLKSQAENEAFVTKPGVKRKLESSSGPPATKKLRHS